MQLIQTSLVHKVSPSSDSQTQAHPALILLHGRGADENDLLGLVPYLDPRFFVVSARAPFQFPWGGYAWYEILEVGNPEPQQFRESYDRLAQFIGDVKKGYPVDPQRTFLLGFSMGSVMSYAYSLTNPTDVRGVVAHSGYIPESTHLTLQWERLGGSAFFVAHGAHDPVISVDFGRRANDLLSKVNADLTYREYPIAHQISEQSLQDLSSWLRNKLDSAEEST